MALLTRGQKAFAGQLAAQTGLNARVVGSWLLAEQSGGAARSYEAKGYNNWLNIARTDSGDRGGAHSDVWRDPIKAANATAEWLQGKGRIAHEYGKPAAGIQRIIGTKGASAQIQAIASSGWASSGYNGGSTLRSLYHELGGEKIPAGAASAAPGAAPGATEPLGTSTSASQPQLSALAVQNVLKSLQGPAQRPNLGGQVARQQPSTAPNLPNQGKTLGWTPPAQGADPQAVLAQLLARSQPQVESKVTGGGGDSSAHAAAQALPPEKGIAHFGGKPVAGWIAPILQYAKEHGWKGGVTSGFRTEAEQTRIFNSGVRPAAKPGTSNHEGADFPRGAVDVSEAAQLAAIISRSPYKGRLQWAGAKDPVHFSHPHNGSY